MRCRILLPHLLLFAVLSAWVMAADGRDFAGFYQISNVTESEEHVTLTLTVRISNYSGAAVSDAAITLEDSLAPGQAYATSQPVSIAAGNSVRVLGEFVIPRGEYDRWRLGGTPSLWIAYVDADSAPARRLIELAETPIPDQE